MVFRQLFDPTTSTYTYLIAAASTKEAILVDPVVEQVERDAKLVIELGFTLKYCLETHVHADHITGAGKLRELLQCENIVPKNSNVDCADRTIGHGERLKLGSIRIDAIATPGHTNSHMAYLIDDARVLTGDALLIRGCGRTDFQGGDPGELYDSVTNRLFTLPAQTWVYPGHDYCGHTVSTIGEEKQWNPRFFKRTRASFIAFMNNLDLPNPKKMMEAVPANQACGKPIMGEPMMTEVYHG